MHGGELGEARHFASVGLRGAFSSANSREGRSGEVESGTIGWALVDEGPQILVAGGNPLAWGKGMRKNGGERTAVGWTEGKKDFL